MINPLSLSSSFCCLYDDLRIKILLDTTITLLLLYKNVVVGKFYDF
jgi:hypothetical protein